MRGNGAAARLNLRKQQDEGIQVGTLVEHSVILVLSNGHFFHFPEALQTIRPSLLPRHPCVSAALHHMPWGEVVSRRTNQGTWHAIVACCCHVLFQVRRLKHIGQCMEAYKL